MKPITAQDISVDVIQSNLVWADFVEAFAAIMSVNVDGPTDKLTKLRFLQPLTEQALLQGTARMLGFNPAKDMLDMNSDTMTKLVTQLPMYPDYNSTVYFENFIDLLLNATTQVAYLFSKDYVNFYDAPQGTLVTDGGEWFQTTHIGLSIELHGTLTDQYGQSYLSRILELFYQYCPIVLVLEHLFFTINYEVGYGYAAVLRPPELEITLEY